MVESSAHEASEKIMLEGLMKGHEALKRISCFQDEIISEIGEEKKMEYEHLEISKELEDEVRSLATNRLDKALRIKEKLKMHEAVDGLKEEIVEKYRTENIELSDEEQAILSTKVMKILDDLEYELFRNIVVKEHIRADGRKMDEIRPLSTDIDLLPRTHGSALFTRGETQALSVTTLGALGEHQILDGLEIEDQKRFMLHYNFPSFFCRRNRSLRCSWKKRNRSWSIR